MPIQPTVIVMASFEVFPLVGQEARRQQASLVGVMRQMVAGLEEVDIEKVPEDIIPGSCGALFDAVFEVQRRVLRMVLNEVESTLEEEEQLDGELVNECVERVKGKLIRLSQSVVVTEVGVAPLRE